MIWWMTIILLGALTVVFYTLGFSNGLLFLILTIIYVIIFCTVGGLSASF